MADFDSDETVGSESDVTLPPSDYEEQDQCHSPDLFDDPDPVQDLVEKSKMAKRLSKAHDMSDSDSNEEMDITPERNRKKHKQSSPTGVVHSQKKTFIDEFLNMTDSDSDQESLLKKKPCKTASAKSSQNSNSERDKKHLEETKMKLEMLKKQKEAAKKFDDRSSGASGFNSKGSNCESPSSRTDKHHFSEKPHKKNYSKPFEEVKHSSPTIKTSHDSNHSHESRKTLSHKDVHSSSSSKVLDTERKKERSRPTSNHTSTSSSSLKRKHSPSPVESDRKRSSLKPDRGSNSTPSPSKPRTESNFQRSSSAIKESKHNAKVSSSKHSPVPSELRKAFTEILQGDSEHKNANKVTKKPPCPYGLKCYRKNPSHFEDFSHPGKDDHVQQSTPQRNKLKTDSPSNVKVKQDSTKVKVREDSSSKLKDTSPSKVTDRPSQSAMFKDTSSPKVKVTSPKVKVTPGSSTCHITNPRNIREVFQQAQPYSFFLTKVSGIDKKFNSTFAMDIKDILSEEMGNITASCQFNFMFDIPWLVQQYPAKFRKKPLLLVHGEKGPAMAALQGQAMPYDNIRFCQAKLDIMYGTHHTKMMLLLYEDGLRIVVHTSNLIQQDWHQKTQGMWISPVFPRIESAAGADKGDSCTCFKRDLIDYMTAYKAYQLKDWIEHISKHDMSTARVVFLGSIPGRHIDKQKTLWGHMKLRRVLQLHGPSQITVKSWPVIGQFSSIGSMGANQEGWLCGEWLQSLSTTKTGSGIPSNARLQLIFPSKDNVRLSLEGFPAGGSIPYSVNTAKKQMFLHNFFHVWKSDGRGRTKAMPHIKTYIRPIQDGSKAAWFIVTSSNLSKAAWGAFEKKGAQLMIRSYEAGVMFLPKFFDGAEHFGVTTDSQSAVSDTKFLLPYDLPTSIYEKKDRAWMWDIPYMDLPDTNGNVWCPFSKGRR